MGVGRRMGKKQGIPTLDESHFAKLKQQPGVARGKKRKASGEVVLHSTKRANGARKSSSKDVFMSGAIGSDNKKSVNSVNGSKSQRVPLPQSLNELSPDDDDDDAADLKEAFERADEKLGLEDIMPENGEAEDLGNELGLEDIMSEDGVEKDEFLDSASSVFDSEPDEHRHMFSEDEGESDTEKLTAANIEGLSRKLEAKQRTDAADAQLELEEAALQTNIALTERPKIIQDDLDSADDGDPTRPKTTLHLAPDLQLLRTRITETIRVLDSFASLSEDGRSRAEYRTQLLNDICAYYSYSPFLAEKLLNLFPPNEAFAFFEANESPRPVVIRTNTLKTNRRELAQALITRGVTLEPVGKWSKLGLQVFESPVPLGATPEYLAGHYMLQAASSFLPVISLACQEHERVLDMSAAPGGKTSYMAACMKNTGAIFANDASKSRSKALIGNVHRMGVRNTVVSNYDARQFPKVMGGFDRVLLDAPCSGTGVISKDPTVKTHKTPRDFLALPHRQKQLLLCAIDSTNHASATGGVIVYSTCSVTIEENEMVIQYVLRKRPNVKIEETGLGTFGVPGFTSYMGKKFDKDMAMCRRYYPHKYNVDGFFVCRLRKTGPTLQDQAKKDAVGQENGASEEMDGVEDENGKVKGERKEAEDDFGGWDEEEDQVWLERIRRRRLRKMGIDVRADRGKKGKKHAEGKNSV